MTVATIAKDIERSGFCIYPNYLTTSTLNETRGHFELLLSADRFHRAGVGHTVGPSSGPTIQDSIRRDDVYWLARTDASEGLWRQIDELQTSLNQTLFLGLNDFEAHYACYPPGGFYSRHRDAFATANARVVSVIIYLNDGWQESDGGRLRLYSDKAPVDVNPLGGTLVCFLSSEIEHEVLPSFATRKSIAGWFRRQDVPIGL